MKKTEAKSYSRQTSGYLAEIADMEKMGDSKSLERESEVCRNGASDRLTGKALRSKCIANISSILDECNMISDSMSRLSIQGNCLDLLTNLEEMLEGLELEN